MSIIPSPAPVINQSLYMNTKSLKVFSICPSLTETKSQQIVETKDECSICLECPATVRFQPCGHCVTCEDCSTRVKKCFQCHAVVLTKVTKGSYALYIYLL